MIKKLFGTDSCPTNNKLQHLQDNYVGKQFSIGYNTVTAESVIAEGGFSVVMRVRSNNGQIFALKRIKVNSQCDLEVAKREIELLRSFNHKNILRFIDSSISVCDNGIWEIKLLTGYCSNNLVNLMNCHLQQRKYFSELQILTIFRDVVAALAYLHHSSPSIFHRDIKVDNVLVDEGNSFVLCDFGSATTKIMNPKIDGVNICQEEINKYTTLSYRSPEMIDLYSCEVIDISSDIWALGCLLYYLSYLNLPFGENTLKISSVQFTIPSHPKFSTNLKKLIGYILQQKCQDRPDIFQVAALISLLMKTSCLVENRQKRSVPSWDSLPSPIVDDGTTQTQSASSLPRSSSNGYIKPTTVATSVAPRQRPKPGQPNTVNTPTTVASTESNKNSLLINLDDQSQSNVNEMKMPHLNPVTTSESHVVSYCGGLDEFLKADNSPTILCSDTQNRAGIDQNRKEEILRSFESSPSQPSGDDLMSFNQPFVPQQVAAAMAACNLNGAGKSQSVHNLAQPSLSNQYFNNSNPCQGVMPGQIYSANRMCPPYGTVNNPRLRQHNSFNYYSSGYNPNVLYPAYHQLTQPNPSPNSHLSGQSSSSCMTPPLQTGLPPHQNNLLSVQRHRRLVSDTSALNTATSGGVTMNKRPMAPLSSIPLNEQTHTKTHLRSHSTGNSTTYGNVSNMIGVNIPTDPHQLNHLEDNAFGEEFDRLRSS